MPKSRLLPLILGVLLGLSGAVYLSAIPVQRAPVEHEEATRGAAPESAPIYTEQDLQRVLELREPKAVSFPIEWIKWILGSLGILILGAIGIGGRGAKAMWDKLWTTRENDIKAIHKALESKVDSGIYEQNRKEMMEVDDRLRKGLIDCHEKMEGIDQRAQQRHSDVMNAILSLKK